MAVEVEEDSTAVVEAAEDSTAVVEAITTVVADTTAVITVDMAVTTADTGAIGVTLATVSDMDWVGDGALASASAGDRIGQGTACMAMARGDLRTILTTTLTILPRTSFTRSPRPMCRGVMFRPSRPLTARMATIPTITHRRHSRVLPRGW